MELSEIKDCINRWNDIRNSGKALKYLSSGYGIEVYRDDYNKWFCNFNGETDKKYIHLYLGIDHNEISFFLIDSKSDEEKSYITDNNLISTKYFCNKKYSPEANHLKEHSLKEVSNINKLSENIAFERILKWFFDSKSCFENYCNQKKTVQVFQIPFNDLIECFNYKNVQKAILFFGITDFINDNYSYDNCIEMILCSDTNLLIKNYNTSDTLFEDVITPHPPFSTNNKKFNLL